MRQRRLTGNRADEVSNGYADKTKQMSASGGRPRGYGASLSASALRLNRVVGAQMTIDVFF